MDDSTSRDDVETLLVHVLDVPPGQERRDRFKEVVRRNPHLEQQLEESFKAFEDRPWLEQRSEQLISAPIEDRIGKSYRQWKIVEPLGEGGMGEVYVAERIVHGAVLRGALKLLRRRVHTDDERRQLQSELIALSQVAGHPNVIQVLDAGIDQDGDCFLVTELVEGCELQEWVRANQPTIEERVTVFQQVLQALDWVHTKGRAHRDVKPQNLMIHNGHVKLLDFGLAMEFGLAANQRPPSAFTPEYASPEQRNGESPGTSRSDQYSAALVLRELLTGNRARVDEQTSVLPIPSRVAGLSDGLRRALVDDLDWILTKALAREPGLRYETVREFKEDLTRYLRHEPVSARPASWIYRVKKFQQREPRVLGLFAGIATIAVIAGAGWRQSAINRDHAEQRAHAVSDLTRLVTERALTEMEKLPGTLRARDAIVRSVSEGLKYLSGDAHNKDLAVALARAKLKTATVNSSFRGASVAERNESLSRCTDALKLLEAAGGVNGSSEMKDLMANAASCRAETASIENAVEWRRQAVVLRRHMIGALGDWQARSALANALTDLAWADFQVGLEIDGMHAITEALKIRRQLVRERPLDLEALRELAKGEELQALSAKAHGREAEAARHYQRASDAFRDLSAKEKGFRAELELAHGLTKSAQYLESAGRKVEAIAAIHEGVNILRRQHRLNIDDINISTDLAEALIEVARDEPRTHAGMPAHEALDILEELIHSGKGGPSVIFQAGEAWRTLGEIAENRFEKQQALRFYEKAAEKHQEFISTTGGGFYGDASLGRVLDKIAALKWVLGTGRADRPPSIDLLRKYESRAESRGYMDYEQDVAWSVLADGQIRAGDFKASQSSLGQARAIWTRILDKNRSSESWYRFAHRSYVLADVLDRSGDFAGALRISREGVEAIETAQRLDPRDFDVTVLRIEAASQLVGMASQAGNLMEASNVKQALPGLIKNGVAQMRQLFPIDVLRRGIYAAVGAGFTDDDSGSVRRQIEPWVQWLATQATILPGIEARLLSLEIRTLAAQASIESREPEILEAEVVSLLKEGESLQTKGPVTSGLAETLATTSGLVVLLRRLADRPDDEAETLEYIRKARQYQQIAAQGGHDTLVDPGFMLRTQVARMAQYGGRSDANALGGVDSEVRRWETFWRVGQPPLPARIGMAIALFQRAEIETDKEHPQGAGVDGAIKDLARAEASLEPIRNSFPEAIGWIPFAITSWLGELYLEKGQNVKAMGKFRALLRWPHSQDIGQLEIRAAALYRLAKYQDNPEVMEEVAAMIEHEILATKVAGKTSARPDFVTVEMPWGAVGGVSGISAQGRLLQSLGSLRLAQARKTIDGPSRVRLVSRAGKAYKDLLGILDSIQDDEYRQEFPSAQTLVQLVEACHSYKSGGSDILGIPSP